jgi:hypothetical protein
MFQPTSSRSSKTAGSCLATALGRDCEHNRAPRWSSVPIIVNEPDGITETDIELDPACGFGTFGQVRFNKVWSVELEGILQSNWKWLPH